MSIRIAFLVAFCVVALACGGGGGGGGGGAIGTANRILFTSNRVAPRGIYSMNPDGTVVRRVTPLLVLVDDLAVWSPDRSKIAYSATRNGKQQVYEIGRAHV